MSQEIIFAAFIISFLCSFFVNAVARGIARKNKFLLICQIKIENFIKELPLLLGEYQFF